MNLFKYERNFYLTLIKALDALHWSSESILIVKPYLYISHSKIDKEEGSIERIVTRGYIDFEDSLELILEK
jgi:hypothetical protein